MIYDHNINILKARCPEIYDWLVLTDEDPRIEVIHCENGLHNLRIRWIEGKSVCFYDMKDPLGNLREALSKEDWESKKLIVLIGAGLGYEIEILRERISRGVSILILEKNATILKKFLWKTDITGLIEAGSLLIMRGDEENIQKTVYQYSLGLGAEDIAIVCNRKISAALKEYQVLEEWVRISIGRALSFFKGTKNGKLLINNDITNLPKFLLSPGVRNFGNRFEGIPAIIISAGPSLGKQIHLLKKAEGRALLLATEAVVRVLFAHDIRPSFIVSTDPDESTFLNFDGLDDDSEIPLVFPITLSSKVVFEYQGPTIPSQDVLGVAGFLGESWEPKGYIRGGASVAIYALQMGIYLGCDPIIFVGQDLSFSNETHISGAAWGRSIDPRNLPESIFMAEGLYGEKVATTARFLEFRKGLEENIALSNRTFINSTLTGLPIQGTKVLSLEEAIESYCGEDRDLRLILWEGVKPGKVQYRRLTHQIEDLLRDFDALEERIKLVLLESESNGGSQAGSLGHPDFLPLEEKARWFNELESFAKKYPWFSIYLHGEFPNPEGSKTLQLRTPFSKQFLTSPARSGVIFDLRSRFAGLLDILRGIEKYHWPGQKKRSLADYSYGKVLAKTGLHKLAVEQFQAALDNKWDLPAIHYAKGCSLLKLGRLREARECFRKGREKGGRLEAFFPKLKEIEEKMSDWRKKAESHLQGGDWVNSLLYIRKIIRVEPGDEGARRMEEKIMEIRQYHHAELEEGLQRIWAERKMKTRIEMLILSGKESIQKGEWERAKEILEEVLRSADNLPEVENLLAFCYSEIGDIEGAKDILERLSRLYRESGSYPFWLGTILRRGDDRDLLRAAENMEMAGIREDRFLPCLYEAGTIYMQKRDFGRAMRCFKRYLRGSPESYELWGKMGTCFLAQGNLGKAQEMYQRALQIQPNYLTAREGLRKIDQFRNRRTRCGSPICA